VVCNQKRKAKDVIEAGKIYAQKRMTKQGTELYFPAYAANGEIKRNKLGLGSDRV